VNNALIIQECWSTDAWTAPLCGMFYDMLRLTFPRHAAYARAHSFDYWCILGDEHDEKLPTGAWDKIHLMRRALERGYEFVAWLDTDAAIADMDCDLRDALPADKLIGACLHDPAKSEYLRSLDVPAHFNVGVMYLRSHPRTVEFIEDWLGRHPGHPRWQEQGAFNEMVLEPKYADLFTQIDDKWNATVNVNPVAVPNVIGWHGIMPVEKRLALMRETMKDDFIKFKV
jgi:hypothetical protein